MKLEISRDNLVRWFMENYPDLVSKMMEADHNKSITETNPYHSEGTVWAHTMMVMTYIEAKKCGFSDESYHSIIAAGLLHDVGKPSCRIYDSEKDKISFFGHEGVSSMLAIDILNHIIRDFETTKYFFERTLKIISLHGTNISQYDSYYHLEFFRSADKAGAVRLYSEYGDYPPRKFSNNHDSNSENKVILLCGLPCSGKSTYIKENYPDAYIISRDDIIMQYGDNYNEAWALVHGSELIKKEVDKKFSESVNKSKNEQLVVVDMTLLSLKSRRTIMNRLGKRNYSAIFFATGLSEIRERNKNRNGKYIKIEVFDDMMKRFVIPHEVEGFSNVEIAK